MSTWPLPREPRPTPWQPTPTAPTPLPSAPSQWQFLEMRRDWLAERLFEQRVVSLTGRLDAESANQASAKLMLLDASGDEPVELHLCDVEADLGVALTLVDTLDLMGVPVHATCLGQLTGLAVAILAVADRRTAGPHASLRLSEPRTQLHGRSDEVAVHAGHHQRRLRRLLERLAEGCRRTVDDVTADMRAGGTLTAEEARGYGLIDAVTGTHVSRPRATRADGGGAS